MHKNFQKIEKQSEKSRNRAEDKALFTEDGSTFMHIMQFDPLLNGGSDAYMVGYSKRRDRMEPQDKPALLINFIIRILDKETNGIKKNRYCMAEMVIYAKKDLTKASFEGNRIKLITIYPCCTRSKKTGEIALSSIEIHAPEHAVIQGVESRILALAERLNNGEDNIKDLMVTASKSKTTAILKSWIRSAPFSTNHQLTEKCKELKRQGWNHELLSRFYNDYTKLHF